MVYSTFLRPSLPVVRVSVCVRVESWKEDKRLTTDHVIAVHVNNGEGTGAAVIGHTDTSTISLVLVVDEDSGHNSVG